VEKIREEFRLSFSGDLYPSAGATSVLTTKGDLVDFDTIRQRLAIGSANQLLQVKSNLPSWETVDLADTVLTTQGDVLYENGSGLARLGFGTSGDVLTTKGTGANPVWETPSGGGASTANNNDQSGNFSTTSTSLVDVTNMNITLPTTTAASDDCLVMYSGSATFTPIGGAVKIAVIDNTTAIVAQEIAPSAAGYGVQFAMQTITDASGNTAKLQMASGGGTALLRASSDRNSVLTAFAV